MESALTCQVLSGTVVLFLALPSSLLVSAAHQRAFDVDVITLAQLSSGLLAEAVPRDDSMPLRLGVQVLLQMCQDLMGVACVLFCLSQNE